MLPSSNGMAVLLLLSGLMSLPAVAQEATASSPLANPVAAADGLLNVLDAIVEHHVRPPSYQEMLLAGIRGTMQSTTPAKERELARQVSQLSDRDSMRRFLVQRLLELSLPRSTTDPVTPKGFLDGVASVVVGKCSFLPKKELVVQQQIRSNRYVGIGITISMEGGLPVMAKVLPRGPAFQAGCHDGDIILSVDEQRTEAQKIATVVDWLRGAEGTPVTVELRGRGSDKTRTVTMERGEVPFDTVVGTTQDDQGNWQFQMADHNQIALLKITGIRPSTTRELRDTAAKLKLAGCRALVVDLQQVEDGELRHAAMIADLLLPAGVIGYQFAHSEPELFRSSDDQLFAGWPVAVLVGPATGAQGAWIAAALQDRQRGVCFGPVFRPAGLVSEVISLPSGDGIFLSTAMLLRGNEQPLAAWEVKSDGRPSSAMEALRPPGDIGFVPRGRGTLVTAPKLAVDYLKLQLAKTARAE